MNEQQEPSWGTQRPAGQVPGGPPAPDVEDQPEGEPESPDGD